jgi:hypothetical protein
MSRPALAELLPLLSVPVLLAGPALALAQLGPLPALAVVGALAAAVPLAVRALGRGGGILWAVPGVALFAGSVLAVTEGLAATGPGMALLGGFVAAGALLPLALLLRFGRHPAVYLFGLLVGLVQVTIVGAALGRLAAPSAGALPASYGAVLAAQVSGLGVLLGGQTGAALPLQSLPAPGLLALMLVALAGAFLSFFVPPEPEAAEAAGDPSGLLGPVAVGAFAAAGFEALAATRPEYALFVLSAAVYAGVIAVIVLARRPPEGRGARERRATPPDRGSTRAAA